jgi:hypothetical protein
VTDGVGETPGRPGSCIPGSATAASRGNGIRQSGGSRRQGMAKDVLRKRILRGAATFGLLLFLAFYLVQHSRMAENHTDGGLILTYVDDISNGLLPHRDFIDAYGLLNWPAVVLFYQIAGQKVWGIRLWMLTLKLIIVVVSFKVVRRFAGTFYATLAALWMMLLYGMAWQSLQTAYGFNNVIPFIIGAWYYLLSGPHGSRKNMILAGIMTGIAVWTKVNAGLFLMAGGLFHCFYWLPVSEGESVRAPPRWLAVAFRWAQYGGLAFYVFIFHGYIKQYFDANYFAYLLGPLLIGVFVTLSRLFRTPVEEVPVFHHLKTWSIYAGVTTAFVLAVLVVAAGGPASVYSYVTDQADIMLYLDYMLPFSDIGVPDEFIGFNENYWLQLPWLFTMIFVAWLALGLKGRAARAYGPAFDVEHSRGVGLYMLTTLYQFCMYSRADETHVFQAMVVVPPALFGLLSQIERLILANGTTKSGAYRWAVGTAAVLWGSTIAIVPGLAVFDLSTGERRHAKLQYLRFRELENPYVRDFSPDLTDNEWDRVVDIAAEYVDERVPDGDRILVLDANRLIHVLSNTRPVGGRYHFYFYLISTKLYKRPGFDKAVPPEVLRDIVEDPPLIAIGTIERIPPVAKAFPELRRLVVEKYVMTRRIRHILIYELKEEYRKRSAAPVSATRLGSSSL